MGVKENIKLLRKNAGMTQEQLAEKLGVTRPTVTQWESGWSAPRMGMVQKIAAVFGVTPSQIVDDDKSALFKGFIPIRPGKTVPIRVVDHVHAGVPTDPDEADYIVEVPEAVIHPNEIYVGYIVDGDCMDKVYPEGCLIVIRLTSDVRNGAIGVFRIDGYQTVMRRVHRGANTLILSPESHNPNHKDIIITEESGETVEAIGTVVWFQAKEELS